MAKIAVDLRAALTRRLRDGALSTLRSRPVMATAGWCVEDVTCTAGPSDAAYEERHSMFHVALVGAGIFGCRGPAGRELLTPGCLLLGNADDDFECGHEHGTGDRCLSFGYAPSYFARIAADAGVRHRRFRALRVPAVRAFAPLTVLAFASWTSGRATPLEWEELAVRLAAQAIGATEGRVRTPRVPPNAEARVARAVRLIDQEPTASLTLQALASEASLSPYHFLRTFARVTNVTPHRYVLRARLRRAAASLAAGDRPVIDVAFECGFRDVSTFNRAFRAELGMTPRAFRRRCAVRTAVPRAG